MNNQAVTNCASCQEVNSQWTDRMGGQGECKVGLLVRWHSGQDSVVGGLWVIAANTRWIAVVFMGDCLGHALVCVWSWWGTQQVGVLRFAIMKEAQRGQMGCSGVRGQQAAERAVNSALCEGNTCPFWCHLFL